MLSFTCEIVVPYPILVSVYIIENEAFGINSSVGGKNNPAFILHIGLKSVLLSLFTFSDFTSKTPFPAHLSSHPHP